MALVPMLLLSACTGNQAKFNVKVLHSEGATVNVINVASGDIIVSLAGDVENDELPLAGKADKNALLAVQKEGDSWQTLPQSQGLSHE